MTEPPVEPNPDTLMDRLRQFTEYFVLEFEKVLQWALDFLDGKISTEMPSNVATDIFCVGKEGFSALGSPYAAPAKGLADMLSKKFFMHVEKQKNKKTVSGLLKLVRDFKKQENRPQIRKTLVETCVELFYSYEMAFMVVTNDFGGDTRALLKLAKDAVRIIMHYYTQEQIKGVLSVELLTNSFLNDAKYSLMNNFVSNIDKPNHTIKISKNNKEVSVKTFKLYSKAGIVTQNEEGLQFYKTNYSNTEKYGYRRHFTDNFRAKEDINDLEEETNIFNEYEFQLTADSLPQIATDILAHINKNDIKLAELRTKQCIEENSTKTIAEVRITSDEIKALVDTKTNIIIEKIQTITNVSSKVDEIEQSVGDLKEDIRTQLQVLEKDDVKVKDQLRKEIVESIEQEGKRIRNQVKKEVNLSVTRVEKAATVFSGQLADIDPSPVIKREGDRIANQVKNEVKRFFKRF